MGNGPEWFDCSMRSIEEPLMVLPFSANMNNFFSHLFILSYLEVVLPLCCLSILCFVGARGYPISGEFQYPLETFSVGVGSFFHWPIIQLAWQKVVNAARQRNLPERPIPFCNRPGVALSPQWIR